MQEQQNGMQKIKNSMQNILTQNQGNGIMNLKGGEAHAGRIQTI